MATNKDVISADMFDKIIGDTYTPVDEFEWCGITLRVKKVLTLMETMEFVRNVADSCFARDTGEYLPEIFEFAEACSILEFYGNIELPDDIEKKYQIVYCTDILDAVVAHVDINQLENIIDAANKKVKHRAKSNIEALTKQMNEAISQFASLEESISKVFAGIDNDSISSLVNAISNGGFNEERVVDAIMAKRNVAAVM